MSMVSPEWCAAALWVLWIVSWYLAAAWSDRALARPGARSEVLYRLLAVVGVLLLAGWGWGDVAALRGMFLVPSTEMKWACVVAIGASLAFTWWARIYLGRLWSGTVTRKAGHRIVDTGPYGIVRHPIYTGISAAAIATALLRGQYSSAAGAAVLIASWFIKARLEERFLREELGRDAYDAYAKRVPMLVPLLRW